MNDINDWLNITTNVMSLGAGTAFVRGLRRTVKRSWVQNLSLIATSLERGKWIFPEHCSITAAFESRSYLLLVLVHSSRTATHQHEQFSEPSRPGS